MNYCIKPRPTVYKGYRFRSRLEARWAVFFDNLRRVEWRYEPDTYDTTHGPVTPDFVISLPASTWFVEVKPTVDHLTEQAVEKYDNLVYRHAKSLDLHHSVGWLFLIGDPKDSQEHGSSIGNMLRCGALDDSDSERLTERLICPAFFSDNSCIEVCNDKAGITEEIKSASRVARQYDFMQYLSN